MNTKYFVEDVNEFELEALLNSNKYRRLHIKYILPSMGRIHLPAKKAGEKPISIPARFRVVFHGSEGDIVDEYSPN